jgi:hypothetical protein
VVPYMGGCLSRGFSKAVATNILFASSRYTLLDWGFAKAGAAIHGMAAPCLAALSGQAPKPAGARPSSCGARA